MKITVKSGKPLYWLLPDDLLPEKYGKERPDGVHGVPQTMQLITVGTDTIPMTRSIQEWLFALNPGLERHEFSNLFDTWNVVGKVRDSANYITGERLTYPLPKYPITLTFGGNVVTGTEMTWPGGGGVAQGERVLCLDYINPDNLQLCGHPSNLIHHLNIITTSVYEGRQRINPFPYLDGRNGRPCFTGLLSNKPLYVEMGKVRRVGETPNPYWPEWT